MPMKPRVIIESPYSATTRRNLRRNQRYLRACMADALRRGEAPYASHGLYTQPGVLDDQIPQERNLGIEAGFAWRAAAEYTCVYTDLGTSGGMCAGIAHARSLGHPVLHRTLGEAWARSEALREGNEDEDDGRDDGRDDEEVEDARLAIGSDGEVGEDDEEEALRQGRLVRVDYDDAIEDVVEKFTHALRAGLGVEVVDDGKRHDGYCLYRIARVPTSSR